jgi:predicted Zn-dependent protease
MGVPATGSYNAFRVDNGTLTEEAMKEKPYLHVVSFSDFQVDSMSGYIGGEIRLAYLYDGKTVTPVTGGSISGNLLELQKNLTFSKERYKDSRYEGPHMICLKGMAVAGA